MCGYVHVALGAEEDIRSPATGDTGAVSYQTRVLVTDLESLIRAIITHNPEASLHLLVLWGRGPKTTRHDQV